MAVPTILVNSASGSDAAASGAGPATALTGAAASTSGTGLVVTLDGSPDLTNVATDGSHVIYLADATAGNRNFGKITAKDNTAKTVTVADAFGLSLTGQSWAIGGVRASAFGANSLKLFNNNAAAGDAMPGWTVQLASGHAETFTGFALKRSGDTTNGPITLQGAPGYSVRPVLTDSSANSSFDCTDRLGIVLRSFELRKTNATPGNGFVCNSVTAGASLRMEDVLVNGQNCGSYAVVCRNEDAAPGLAMLDCFIDNTAGGGLYMDAATVFCLSCYFRGRSGVGVFIVNYAPTLDGCIIAGSSGHGVQLGTDSAAAGIVMLKCTVNGNGGDGLHFNSGPLPNQTNLIVNSIFSNNGGYGVNFGASFVDAAGPASTFPTVVLNNDFFGNTTAATNPATLPLTNRGAMAVDPQFTNVGSLNFGVGTNLKAAAYPAAPITGTATQSFLDVGAAQRQEPTGGGGGAVLSRVRVGY